MYFSLCLHGIPRQVCDRAESENIFYSFLAWKKFMPYSLTFDVIFPDIYGWNGHLFYLSVS